MGSPAFQFYPADFLADENQMLMELAEVGAYIRLICVCWKEGSIPTDLRKLARLAGCAPRDMAKVWPALEPCFEAHHSEPGRLVHPRLERERVKQEKHKQKMREAGKKGADTRYNPQPSDSQAIARLQPGDSSASTPPPSSSFPASAASSPSGKETTNRSGRLNVEKSSEHTIGSVAMEAHRVLGMGTWGDELSEKFNDTKRTIRTQWVAGGVSLDSLYRAIHGLRIMVDGEEVEWLKDRKQRPLDGIHVLTKDAVVQGPDGSRRAPLFQLAQEAYARDGPSHRTVNSGPERLRVHLNPGESRT